MKTDFMLDPAAIAAKDLFNGLCIAQEKALLTGTNKTGLACWVYTSKAGFENKRNPPQGRIGGKTV
jgi:hypothetical protein